MLDSTRHTGLTDNAERYATAGVPDYWALDLNGNAVAPLAVSAASLRVIDLLP